MYDRPCSRTSFTTAGTVHRLLLASCTHTCSPARRGDASRLPLLACFSLLSKVLTLLFLAAAWSVSGEVNAGSSGRRPRRPWNISKGENPSALGVFCHVYMPSSHGSSRSAHLANRDLTCLTAASAKPLLSGLNADEGSNAIFLLVQYSLKLSRYCGPPSALALAG